MCIVLSILFTSSLAHLYVLFRRRLKSVADVPEGTRSKGFTQTRWDALLGYWEAVSRHGPCGPISSLDPWDKRIPPDLHGFYKSVFDSLDSLNDFLQQVVVSRRDLGIREWTWWLRGRFGFQTVCWILFHLLLFSSSRMLSPSLLGFWLSLISLMLNSARLGYLSSVGLVILLSLLISSWILLVIFCLQESPLDLPSITGRDLLEVARAKKSTAGGLDGWAWNEIKALPLPLVLWSGHSFELG